MSVNPRFGRSLTDQQKAVLRWMAKGLSDKQIAAEMHLSVNTVRSHARRINEQFGVNSRIQAVLTAVEDGVVACPCAARVAEVESRPVAS